MASGVTFKIDRREFDKTLRKYRELSKRTPEQIVNTKAFYICRRAVLETPKAAKEHVQSDLGKFVEVFRGVSKTGKTISRRKLVLVHGDKGAPLAALILNSRRGKKDEPGLYGAAMKRAIRGMLSARMASIAFIKSGWLPAIKALLPLADKRGAPPAERGPKQIGPTAKGEAIPAKGQRWNAKAIIVNMANARHDAHGTLVKLGRPALQKAFNAEERSMRKYIEDKHKENATAAGIKHS